MNDLEDKTGETVAATTLKIKDDGSYEITMMDADGNVLDQYTIDPTTGKGTNQAGEKINLPQTGNNDPATLWIVVSAMLLLGLGWAAVRYSGSLRKKKETENGEDLD